MYVISECTKAGDFTVIAVTNFVRSKIKSIYKVKEHQANTAKPEYLILVLIVMNLCILQYFV